VEVEQEPVEVANSWHRYPAVIEMGTAGSSLAFNIHCRSVVEEKDMVVDLVQNFQWSESRGKRISPPPPAINDNSAMTTKIRTISQTACSTRAGIGIAITDRNT
jgi:hypothetical protein